MPGSTTAPFFIKHLVAHVLTKLVLSTCLDLSSCQHKVEKKIFLGHYTFVYFKLPGFERLKSPGLLFFLSGTWLYILVLVYFLSTKLLAIFNTVIISSTWLNTFNRITVSFKHLLAPSSSTYCNHLYFKTIMVLLPCSTPNKYFHQ